MILGIRCSNTDYTYCVVNNLKNIIHIETVAIPKQNHKHGKSHYWLYGEMKSITEKYPDILKIVLKKAENRTTSNSYNERLQYEGVIFTFGGEENIPVFVKPNKTIAKEICGKGNIKLLASYADFQILENYKNYSPKFLDAIHAAWSEVKC